jgi:hypothetical protein
MQMHWLRLPSDADYDPFPGWAHCGERPRIKLDRVLAIAATAGLFCF